MIDIKLILYLGFNTSKILKNPLPDQFEFVGTTFMELDHIKGILQNAHWILVNLSDLARTAPLDEAAIRKWREVFSDLVQKSVSSNGRYAQLVGIADSPDWSLAELGMAVGVRDLVLVRNLSERLLSSQPNFAKDRPSDLSNVLPFRDPKSNLDHTLSADSQVQGIPINAIPVPIRGLEGQSKATETLRNLVRKCSPTQATLLISGESGSGKEHVARSIHENSLVAKDAFRIVHCSELSESNFEEKLGGAALKGVGTLLIEQIELLNSGLQSRLVAFLIENQRENSNPKVRILVSTQADLKYLCEQGRLREDLFFRINVIEIAIPPLRHRRADFEDLSESLMARIARRHNHKRLSLSVPAFEKFLHYDWPGNIRELENVLEHASLSAWASDHSEIQITDLPEHIRNAQMSAGQKDTLKDAVRKFEKEHIAKTLSRYGGAKEVAAQALGLSLASLYRKLGND